jgi:hypothetical protein
MYVSPVFSPPLYAKSHYSLDHPSTKLSLFSPFFPLRKQGKKKRKVKESKVKLKRLPNQDNNN